MKNVGMHIEGGRHMLMPEVAEQAQGCTHNSNDESNEEA